jgi:hypothetical protein
MVYLCALFCILYGLPLKTAKTKEIGTFAENYMVDHTEKYGLPELFAKFDIW